MGEVGLLMGKCGGPGIGYKDFVSVTLQQRTHPGRMRPNLHCDPAPRNLRKVRINLRLRRCHSPFFYDLSFRAEKTVIALLVPQVDSNIKLIFLYHRHHWLTINTKQIG